MGFPYNTHEKAPVPDGLAAQGTRAEITGKNPPRKPSDTTSGLPVATRPRIVGRLYLRVQS